MALFKAVVWALIFLTKLRFPPGVSIAIVLKVVTSLQMTSCNRTVLNNLLLLGETYKFVATNWQD